MNKKHKFYFKIIMNNLGCDAKLFSITAIFI